MKVDIGPNTVTFNNVLHVPDLGEKTLISVSTILDANARNQVNFGRGGGKIYVHDANNNRRAIAFTRRGAIYTFKAKPKRPNVCYVNATAEDPATRKVTLDEAHVALGHRGHRNIKRSIEAATGLTLTKGDESPVTVADFAAHPAEDLIEFSVESFFAVVRVDAPLHAALQRVSLWGMASGVLNDFRLRTETALAAVIAVRSEELGGDVPDPVQAARVAARALAGILDASILEDPAAVNDRALIDETIRFFKGRFEPAG